MTARRHQQRERHWLPLAVCLAVCLAAWKTPPTLASHLRSALRDAAYPAHIAWNWLRDQRMQLTAGEIRELRREVARLEETERRAARDRRAAELQNANLRDDLDRLRATGASPFRENTSEPLLSVDLLPAAILAAEQRDLLQRGLIVEAGGDRDVLLDAPVLAADDEEPAAPLVVDQGRGAGVPDEAPVYAGRCVVGRVERVGQWTSSVRLITDARYRGRAQILRRVGDGFEYGPQGVLEGTGGELCRLKYLGRTESVQVGDDVYTGGRSETLPYPMYYGRVVQAELNPTDREWTVWVRPAVRPEQLQSVAILRQTVNPLRALGN